MCAVFFCVQTMLWLPAFGIFNVRTDADACNCTQGLYGHRKRVCTGSRHWEKNLLPHLVLKASSVLHLAFQSNALPAQLSPPLLMLTTQMLAVLRALRMLFVCVFDQRSRPSEAEQRDARGLGHGSLQQQPPCLWSGVRCVLGTDGGFLG